MKKTFTLLLLALLFTSVNAQYSGNALDFDGSNDMVVVSTVPALFNSPATNDFTIEAWVNPRGSLFARILFAQPSTSNFVSFGTSTGNVIYFYVIANGTTYSVATSVGITQNQWTHVAAKWVAATSTPSIYFNGVLQTSVGAGSSSAGTSGLMTLGTRPGGGTQYFNGMLDEVRVWSEARTECQILTNMNNSINAAQTNLVVNYNFNQGTAADNNNAVTVLSDLSGNTVNGALTNFTLNGTTSNWVSSGATLTTTGNAYPSFVEFKSATVCNNDSYTFPDGTIQNNITSQVTQVSNLLSVSGCDSVVTTTVSVTQVNNAVTQNGNTLTADETSATYQWVDCNNANADIDNETAQTFTPFLNGSYAVEVTKNSCTSTSTCIPFTITNVQLSVLENVSVYPNPVVNSLSVEFNETQEGTIDVIDAQGIIVLTQSFSGATYTFDLTELRDGLYWVNVSTEKGRATKKIVKD